MRISYLSQVLEPSPQGVFRVEMLRVLVGRRTGPFTLSDFVRARSINSWHTFSSDATLRELSVIRILWIFYTRVIDNLACVRLPGKKHFAQISKLEIVARGEAVAQMLDTYRAIAEILLRLLE